MDYKDIVTWAISEVFCRAGVRYIPELQCLGHCSWQGVLRSVPAGRRQSQLVQRRLVLRRPLRLRHSGQGG